MISVAMATYNGEKYIKEQIDSIISQLNTDDEIVISDDGSTDKTIEIIKSYKDKRIKIYDGPHDGIKQNFANAISKCHGRYIFLSDQDDIWLENKVKIILSTFEKKKCICVTHDAIVFNSSNNEVIFNSFFSFRNSKKGIIKNVIKNSYIGCCMAFDASLKNKVLPIPNAIVMHDQWIGLLSEKYGESVFIANKLIKYRRHGENASNLKHQKVINMLINRIVLIYNYIKRGREK